MKTVCKKLLSLVLVAILLVSAVPFQALADEEGTEVNKGTVIIDGLTLDANGGTVNGATKVTMDAKYQEAISNLPDAARDGYNFAGWYTAAEGGEKVEINDTFTSTTAITLYAHWQLRTNNLELKYIINGDVNTAKLIANYSIAEGNYVWKWLEANAKNDVSVLTGYSWDGFWYDDRLNQLTQQNDTTNIPNVIYVNFVARDYTLYFNAEGGTVSPTSMTVTYNKAVGTLPTPTKSGYIFLGWKDGNGNTYTKDTIYTVADNTTLYAQWSAEASVLLKIYLNGDTSAADRIVDMTGYVKNQSITKDDVASVVKKYYTAKSGSSLKMMGLYNDSTWPAYKADSTYSGANTVVVETTEKTVYVYVMVNNAQYNNSGSTGSTSDTTSSTSTTETKESDPTNPKTGDSSMIYVSMSVMLIAAAALVVVEQLRKRKMI